MPGLKELQDRVADQSCHDCLYIIEVRDTLHTILAEVRGLRRERLPASPEKIEELLASLFTIFRDAPFTSAWAMEESIEADDNATALLRAIEAVQPHPTIRRLSTLLRRSTGTYGDYRLQVVDPHGRDGTMFRVTM